MYYLFGNVCQSLVDVTKKLNVAITYDIVNEEYIVPQC